MAKFRVKFPVEAEIIEATRYREEKAWIVFYEGEPPDEVETLRIKSNTIRRIERLQEE